MQEKPVLPIDRLTNGEFGILKMMLEEKVLSEITLENVSKLYAIGDPSTGSPCNEFHPHSFRCVDYYHPTVAVVHRLLNEIDRYRAIIATVNELNKV